MSGETFTFLITTDNHLGYKKDDSIRYKDSFKAFAEALEIARARMVDFVLLGGDLFHENRPSTSIEHKCIKILRKHMNAQENTGVSFERIEGKFSHFHKLDHANFEDPNMKVACPIMTIHGNHDDPTGPDAQSICEKLATCGLLNYFGAIRSTKEAIVVEPIIFQKGQVKIALYGLGFIPDYKLKILFDKKEVVFKRPPEDTFNVLVVHQNRAPFEKSKCIPDETFPKFFHLLIRGHEHDAQSPEIIPDSEVNGMVYQPGSTVATSISTMEARPKKVCLISVRIADPDGNQASKFKMDYQLIELKSCRKMLMKDIKQKDLFMHIKQAAGTNKITAPDFKRLCKEFVQNTIESMLKDYETKNASNRASIPVQVADKLKHFELPLIRIRLEYKSKNERFDELDLSAQYFRKRVANKDIILFKKQKLSKADDGTVENTTFNNDLDDEDDQDDLFEHVNLGAEKADTIDYMIEKYFTDKPPNERLKALSITEYTNTVRGTSADGNVIAKVLNIKKMEIFRKYRSAINDEKIAGANFHSPALVERWFLEAFGNTNHKTGGDTDMDVIDII